MDLGGTAAFKEIGIQLQEDFLQPLDEISTTFQAVGRIQVYWFDGHNRILSHLTATAFAYDPRTVITCAHNLYSSKYKRVCDRIEFYLEKKGCMERTTEPYRCTNHKQIMFRVPTGPMDHIPTLQELAFFTLDSLQVLPCESYIKIGHIPEYSEGIGLKLVGYKDVIDAGASGGGHLHPIRTEIMGNLHSINGHIINHTMPTIVGHSGSPILTHDRKGKYYAVGIHTHKGNGYNSGLYFSPEILSTAIRFIKTLQYKSQRLRPILLRFPNAQIYLMKHQYCAISMQETDKMYKNDIQQKEKTFVLYNLQVEARDLHPNSFDGPEYFQRLMSEFRMVDSEYDQTDYLTDSETNSDITEDSHQDKYYLRFQTQQELSSNDSGRIEGHPLQDSASSNTDREKDITFAVSQLNQ